MKVDNQANCCLSGKIKDNKVIKLKPVENSIVRMKSEQFISDRLFHTNNDNDSQNKIIKE